MNFLVLNKAFVMPEGRLTFGTAVGLFCGMNGLVSNQVGGSAETLDAFVTFVGPVARVNPQVFVKVSVPVEGFPTLSAFESLLSAMNPLVGL